MHVNVILTTAISVYDIRKSEHRVAVEREKNRSLKCWSISLAILPCCCSNKLYKWSMQDVPKTHHK
jgi:hypothetical protein